MLPKIILILGLTLASVLQAQIIKEHKLESGLKLTLDDCVNSNHEADLTYTWLKDVGLVRREKNRLCLFDTNFLRQWETTLPLDYQNYDYLYRCATDKDYIYLVWYTPEVRKENPGLRLGKIDLRTGDLTECTASRIKEFKSAQYIRIHNDMIYLFGTTYINNLMWDRDKLKDPYYTSGVFVLDKELNVMSNYEIPGLEGADIEFNWMFLGCDDSGFTYVTNLSQRSPGIYKDYSPSSSASEIKRTYTYDFVLKEEKIKRKLRDWYNLNPIKFDTAHFSVTGASVNEYCVTAKFLFSSPSNRSDQSTTVYYLYESSYTPISYLYVRNKTNDSLAGPIGTSDLLLNRKRSLKYSFYLLVDLVEDPLNESITVVLTHQFELGQLYVVTYNKDMQLVSFKVMNEKYNNLRLSNDNNFVSVPISTKVLKAGNEVAGQKNAFDYMTELGQNKFCTIMTLSDRQVLFMDDPETGGTKILEIFPE